MTYSSFTVDDISLSYRNGRLVKADDTGADCSLSIASDFCELTAASNEYSYDACGRLTKDLNKGITSISYNCLGLPQEIRTAFGSIRNTYNSDEVLVLPPTFFNNF